MVRQPKNFSIILSHFFISRIVFIVTDNKRVTHTVLHLDINAPQLEKILNRKLYSSKKLCICNSNFRCITFFFCRSTSMLRKPKELLKNFPFLDWKKSSQICKIKWPRKRLTESNSNSYLQMQIETSGKSTILNLKHILCQRYIYLIPIFDSQFQISQFPNDFLFAFQHKNTFNRVFIGCSVSHLLTSSLRQCLKPEHSVIYIETPLFLLHMSNEILLRFKEYMNNEAEVKFWNTQ